jgi:hypothetical protein
MLPKSTTRSSHVMFRGLQTNLLCNNLISYVLDSCPCTKTY